MDTAEEQGDMAAQLATAIAVLDQHLTDQAIGLLGSYLQARPGDLRAWSGLAEAYGLKFWLFHQALCLDRLLELAPQDAEARFELARVLIPLGQHDRLRQLLEAELHRTPATPRARLMQYLYRYQQVLLAYSEADDQTLFDLIERLPSAGLEAVSAAVPPSGPPSDRPLRIGYLSHEFAAHVSMAVFRPLLQHHRCESFAYDDTVALTDESDELRTRFTQWRRIVGLDNAAAAELIRADGLDVLIDLAGPLNPYRNGIFALRPAPVQAGGLGFTFSSCNRAIDYCFSDRVLCPPELAERFPERVVYLRSALHWQPPAELSHTEPPCLQNGYVTLGSASALNKLNLRVVALWARILQQLPDARLFLKTPPLNDPLTRSFYTELFGYFGIEAVRLRLEGQGDEPHISYFYSQIDIALDPFPYQGGVTSCEALWMGVPVLSLALPQWSSRALAASVLTAAGLQAWLTDSETEYLARALSWARDRDFLARQRRELRARLLASPICDGPAFAAEVEAACRRMRQPQA